LEFDRSAPDLTAHVLLAYGLWAPLLSGRISLWVAHSKRRALHYLHRSQRADGSWVPLWFGNQHVAGEVNPTYATARVLSCLAQLEPQGESAERARTWLLKAQRVDGSWGGGGDSPGSIEETGLALEALGRCGEATVAESITRGIAAVMRLSQQGEQWPPAPIGFYFAKLWYFERLYPLIFATGGLSRTVGQYRAAGSPEQTLVSSAAS
jgi:squalene-hopene/tetraprenyl-beta-curcumene cyclase